MFRRYGWINEYDGYGEKLTLSSEIHSEAAVAEPMSAVINESSSLPTQETEKTFDIWDVYVCTSWW